jgi:L-asparaginase/Glu-tRNA(Gln) amidotransferase subunit D
MALPRIAVFSGPRSTIANTPVLVTSNKGRLDSERELPGQFDHLVPQLLHEPVTVRIKKYTAHPLEEDAKEVYQDDGKDYWEVELKPEDGKYLLPYVARRAGASPEGVPFEYDDMQNAAIQFGGRQTFFPDASGLFADIDRTIGGRDGHGEGSPLSRLAEFDFIRALPPAGYTKQGEVAGADFFPYQPRPIGKFPPADRMARVANVVQSTLATGKYVGGIWLEGSPHVEETLYWISLLIDTNLPLVGISAQRPHGEISGDGDRNIIDAVEYIVSGAGQGLGAVGMVDEQIFAPREFHKGDARPGGYRATGGHGGVLGSSRSPARIWYKQAYKHTSSSEVALPRLPNKVSFLDYAGDTTPVTVAIKDGDGELLGESIAPVHIVKYGHYMAEEDSADPDLEVDIAARVARGLEQERGAETGSPRFHGFIMEAAGGTGSALPSQIAALAVAAFSGMPVVRVGRGEPEGPIPTNPNDLTIEGSNLDATKARMLLRASMLKLGRLPKARDPRKPTDGERAAVVARIAEFQAIFDTH